MSGMTGDTFRGTADGALGRMRKIDYADKTIGEYAMLFEAYARIGDEMGESRPCKTLDEAPPWNGAAPASFSPEHRSA